MRKIAKQKYKLENSELKSINSQWWDDYYDDDSDYYHSNYYDEEYSYLELEPITTHQIRTGRRIGWPKLPIYNSPILQYRRIDMDSIYSKELIREKKINSILGISDYYVKPTLKDFFKE
jgi:hypothetical protein